MFYTVRIKSLKKIANRCRRRSFFNYSRNAFWTVKKSSCATDRNTLALYTLFLYFTLTLSTKEEFSFHRIFPLLRSPFLGVIVGQAMKGNRRTLLIKGFFIASSLRPPTSALLIALIKKKLYKTILYHANWSSVDNNRYPHVTITHTYFICI